MTDTAGAVTQRDDTAPIEVSAPITAEKVFAELPLAHARAVGSLGFATTIPLLGALLGLALPMILLPTVYALLFWVNPVYGIWLNMIEGGLYAAFTVMGYAYGLRLTQRTYHRRYLLGMYRRGMPAEVTASYRVADAGFEVDTSRIRYSVRWPSILELVPTEASLLVVVDSTTFVVPRAAFADAAALRRFVTALLDRMTPQARDRSVEARDLAGGN